MKKIIGMLMVGILLISMLPVVLGASTLDSNGCTTLSEGQTETYTVNGKDYEVNLNLVDPDYAKFIINGEVTSTLKAGESYTLTDGAIIRVSSVQYQDYAGGVKLATFCLIGSVCTSTNTLSEGQVRTYTVNGKNYEVNLNFVDPDEAKFIVNGEATNKLKAGDSYTFSDGAIISVSKVDYGNYAGGVKLAMFCISGVAGTPVVVGNTCSSTNTLLAGDSKTYTVNSKNYEVNLMFVDSDEAKFTVNGEATNKLKAGMSYTLTDGAEITVSKVLYQDYAGGVHSATFCISGVAGTPVVVGNTCSSTNTLSEGQVRTYTVNSKNYEVNLNFVDPDEAKFIVNGEVTSKLKAGMSYTLTDGAEITVSKVEYGNYAGGVKLATFCISGVAGTRVVSGTTQPSPTQQPSTTPPQQQPSTTPTAQPPSTVCNGCTLDGNCVSFGTRVIEEGTAKYCNLYKQFHEQLENEDACLNNYECKSNQCSSNVCVDLVGELRETRNLLQRFWDWLSGIF